MWVGEGVGVSVCMGDPLSSNETLHQHSNVSEIESQHFSWKSRILSLSTFSFFSYKSTAQQLLIYFFEQINWYWEIRILLSNIEYQLNCILVQHHMYIIVQ